eukprot:TRINITY_DN4626_c0_g2_i1.p1 TRINITY_DN4626_c0_g2~~TRINITY_DN4626_c0_g2_i1.p1  ORF type:complete len:288 (+),score=73.24 TRINITY_DN4626_c0_g2_i1:22-885(+)
MCIRDRVSTQSTGSTINMSFSRISPYVYSRTYTGPVKAVILDWSGTTADKYVIAPAVVFFDVFKKFNVPISMKEARLPMGLRKDLHIKAITEIPEVRDRWTKVHGKAPTQTDVDQMFKEFVPMQLEALKRYTTLIPGTAETIKFLRESYGIKIGSTTGFTKAMVDVLLADARKQGYVPDSSVAGDEVIHGARPKPFMVYRNLDLLDVHPIHSVVKVDDTVGGVGEALEAGCWGVGVSRYSNYMDIDSLEVEAALTEDDINYRHKRSREILEKMGHTTLLTQLLTFLE